MRPPVSDETSERLTSLQHELYRNKLTVLILIEGSSGRILGRVANEVMNLLEPRGVEYRHFHPSEGKDPQGVIRFLTETPAAGRIGLFDRGWYSHMIASVKKDPDSLERSLAGLADLERYLTDNGVILVKIYLKADVDRIEEIAEEFCVGRIKDCGRLTDDVITQDDLVIKGLLGRIFECTDKPNAPWTTIEVSDLASTVDRTVHSIIDLLSHRLQYPAVREAPGPYEMYPNPRAEADLTKRLGKDEYWEVLDKRSRELASMQCRLSKSGRSLILVFEGWDASGKGGTIKRIARALNPRGFRAVSFGVPTDEEAAHTYIWRFCRSLPEAGEVTIFDRSWYGRMLVEPVECLCDDDEYVRSPREINSFERVLTEQGAIVLKFWMEISPAEQLERFRAREKDALKSWKITDDDWRNRSKWDAYEERVDRMMELTNTPYAPWTVVEAESKRYGRIKVFDTVISALRKELGD